LKGLQWLKVVQTSLDGGRVDGTMAAVAVQWWQGLHDDGRDRMMQQGPHDGGRGRMMVAGTA
jgi:hypothetical protein